MTKVNKVRIDLDLRLGNSLLSKTLGKNEDRIFRSDELSGSDCYWTNCDSNASENSTKVEINVEKSYSSQSNETKLKLTPKKKAILIY